MTSQIIPALRPDLLAVASLIKQGEKVLDLGCGDGDLLLYLKEKLGVTARGVELSEAGVLSCVRKGVSVRQGDLHEGLVDYPDASFDTVILSYTIPYLNDPAFVIQEMLRVGSRAIVSFPNWGHWRCRLDFLRSGRMPVAPGLPQPWDSAPRARQLTLRDFEDFAVRSGFRIREEIFLSGSTPILPGIAKNLLATTAIFELIK
jgi:methionine biosynthesis protein MetW